MIVNLWFFIQEDFWNDPFMSISNAYVTTDQEILSHSPDLGRGGSTAVTAILINNQKLWVANVGDSRAVVSRGGEAAQMTTDHEPNTERGSIETRGGFVSNMPGLSINPLQVSMSCCLRCSMLIFFPIIWDFTTLIIYFSFSNYI